MAGHALKFHHVGSRNPSQFARPGSKFHELMSHPAGQRLVF